MKPTPSPALCLIGLFCAWHISGLAQGLKKQTADRYYALLAYQQAVPYYEDLARSKQAGKEVLLKAARCHYFLQDYTSAKRFYDRLRVAYPSGMEQIDLLNYLQCLKASGNYATASSWLDTLNREMPGSTVYTSHLQSQSYYLSLKKDSSLYHVYNVAKLNTSNSEFSPFYNPGNGVMVFASNRRNVSARNQVFAWDETYFMDSYAARCIDSLTFEPPVSIEKFRTPYHDGPVVLTRGGRTMFVTRTNVVHKKVGRSKSQLVNLKLFIYKRDSLGRWDQGTEFPYNSNEYSLGHAAISENGTRLYFVSDMPGSYGQTDIWYSDYVGGEWKKPVNPGKQINTEGREMFPFLYNDEVLFYSSDGFAGLGGLDLCYSTIADRALAKACLLAYPLNTSADDFGIYLRKDLKSGYLSSNREGGMGKDDIYYFTSKTSLFGIMLKGRLYDDNTREPIAQAAVYLLDQANRVIDSVRSDQAGNYVFKIPEMKDGYRLGAKERSRYYDRIIPVNELHMGDNSRDLSLFPKYRFICKIYDRSTHAPLDSVQASVVSKYKSERKTYITDAQGSFRDLILNKKVGDRVGYLVRFERPGYITMVQEYDMVLDTNTVIDLNEQLVCGMTKLEKGVDIGKTIHVNPIYFDFGKWDIRPDAAAELDKIVTMMQENPKVRIELGSHTDCRSSAAYNKKLSDKRARSSVDYIVSRGIDRGRIKGVGYGESKLINACECEGNRATPCTEEEHQQNRRTEFLVVGF